jgi:hypothetical protein
LPGPHETRQVVGDAVAGAVHGEARIRPGHAGPAVAVLAGIGAGTRGAGGVDARGLAGYGQRDEAGAGGRYARTTTPTPTPTPTPASSFTSGLTPTPTAGGKQEADQKGRQYPPAFRVEHDSIFGY